MSSRCRATDRHRRHAGFTLVELICAMVLIGVLGAGLTIGFSYFAANQAALRKNYVQTQKIQLAVTRLLYELKNATAISASGNVVSYTLTTAKTLSLKNATLVLTDAGTEHVLTDNVSAFTASYTNSLLTITLTSTLANGATTQMSLSIHG